MKTIIFNASPRKNWSTYKLLKEAEAGAAAAGSDTEFINLYDYKFQGCISCLVCKRKGNTCGGLCAVRDDIRPILENTLDADVLIFGSPVYLHGATAQLRAFLERLLFPITSYTVDENGVRTRCLDKTVRTGIIYTMNNVPKVASARNYETLLGINRDLLKGVYGHSEMMWVHNTWQFTDYDKYDANMFDVKEKKRVLEEEFPVSLGLAYEFGKKLVSKPIICH